MGKAQKFKKIISKVIYIFLIIALLCISLYAWAKYKSVIDGMATGEVARWSFKVIDGNTTTSEIIDFPITRTDSNASVVKGKLAPGTYGQFEIGIDARGTETMLGYTININLNDKPRNLKLYLNAERTDELEVVNEIATIEGFMSLEDVNEIRTETIYWEWKYETGTTAESIAQNDILDTEDMGKIVKMQVSITGYELLEPPFAYLVEVGDYVNYDASSNGVKTFTSANCTNLVGTSISDTISTDEKFNSNAPSQWRVLSIDKENGIVELIAADSTTQTVTLSGGDGFVNAETILNKVGAIYGQGKGAIGGRSITIEDVEKYSSYDRNTYVNMYSSTGRYGGTRDYTSGSFYKETKDEKGNVTGFETTKTTASSTGLVTMTQTSYNYNATDYFSNSTIYNMIFNNKSSYWLASRCVYLDSSNCNFNVKFVFQRWYRQQVYVCFGWQYGQSCV